MDAIYGLSLSTIWDTTAYFVGKTLEKVAYLAKKIFEFIFYVVVPFKLNQTIAALSFLYAAYNYQDEKLLSFLGTLQNAFSTPYLTTALGVGLLVGIVTFPWLGLFYSVCMPSYLGVSTRNYLEHLKTQKHN